MTKPSYLTAGDKVALIATAKCLNDGQLDQAVALIQSWGLEVVEGKHLYSADHYFAGTDEERLQDLQWALDDPGIKAVIFARGGYGTVRLVDRVDWTRFVNQPKWLCGFSDLTVIHSHILRNWNIESLHATMPIFFEDGNPTKGAEALRDALFGNMNELHWSSHKLNQAGEATGQLVGGNCSVLYSIGGTPSQVDWSGKILFLEDLTEHLYHLDRMMMQFKRSGQMEHLAGLVVGQFSDMDPGNPPFGSSAEKIILSAVEEYHFPVAFDIPIGHVADNQAIYHGRKAKLLVGNQSQLSFDEMVD